MVNRVIYLRWGERYNEDHVKRLEQQVKDNCSVPYEFSTINYCYAGPDFDLMKHKQDTHFRGNDVEEAVGEQNCETTLGNVNGEFLISEFGT